MHDPTKPAQKTPGREPDDPATWLAELREAAGLSQSAVDAELGKPRGYIRRVENDVVPPPGRELCQRIEQLYRKEGVRLEQGEVWGRIAGPLLKRTNQELWEWHRQQSSAPTPVTAAEMDLVHALRSAYEEGDDRRRSGGELTDHFARELELLFRALLARGRHTYQDPYTIIYKLRGIIQMLDRVEIPHADAVGLAMRFLSEIRTERDDEASASLGRNLARYLSQDEVAARQARVLETRGFTPELELPAGAAVDIFLDVLFAVLQNPWPGRPIVVDLLNTLHRGTWYSDTALHPIRAKMRERAEKGLNARNYLTEKDEPDAP